MGCLWLPCVNLIPLKSTRAEVMLSMLQAGLSRPCSPLAGGVHVFWQKSRKGKGASRSVKAAVLPCKSHPPTCSPPLRRLHLLDKRASYCYADDALLPISRLIVQLIRQLGDSCRDGFVEHSVLPLIYVTCSNYHLHSSVQQ